MLKTLEVLETTGLTLYYDKSPTILVGSIDNGNGKSTLLVHALFYVLFDKAYGDKDKKTSLINSTNNKDCLVEIEFESNGCVWIIRRGMKPTIFDIIRDGNRVEDEAALKDYQQHLLNILGFDERTFCNTIALGKSRFQSFTTMSAADRRAYSENMLDMIIFSKMNKVTKDKLKDLKPKLSDIHYQLGLNDAKIVSQQKIINLIEDQIQSKSDEIDQKIKPLMDEYSKSSNILHKLNEKTNELLIKKQDLEEKFSDLQKLESAKQVGLSKLDELEKSINKYEHMEICESCKQNINSEVKNNLTRELKENKISIETALARLETTISERFVYKKEYDELAVKINELTSAKIQLNSKLKSINEQISELESMKPSNDAHNKLKEEKDVLISLEKIQNDLDISYHNCEDDIKELNTLLNMLEDDGIKSSIVRQYLPFLNFKINEYLDYMNMWVSIELDEEFNIIMNAPDRKGQGIASLSDGQKCRIDIAVLLAWTDIAKLKSSVDSNILILDEILENLSEQGVQDFINMWNEKYQSSDINLFVISQRKQEFSEYFHDTITYQLIDGFTSIVE